jgi:hypothetical protein
VRPVPLWLLVSLSACTVDPALLSRTRAEMIRYTRALRRQESAPQPGAALAEAWQRGQYAVWAITKGDDVTLVEAQVDQADRDGAIVLMTTLSPKIRTTARLTFSRQPGSLAEAREVLTQVIRQRGEDRPLTYRFYREMPIDMREALEPLWGTLFPSPIDGAPPETAHTIAATLEGCRPGHGVFIASPLGLELRALLHPAVPINGLASGKASTGEAVEVVDLGWAGGAPSL